MVWTNRWKHRRYGRVLSRAIGKLQPRGPYVLVGYSLGGLVVLEMAQRLSANGEKVALLAMLDAYPQFRYLSLGQRLRLIARREGEDCAPWECPRKHTLSTASGGIADTCDAARAG